jgi:DNA-binding transcriptional LysR family regulator
MGVPPTLTSSGTAPAVREVAEVPALRNRLRSDSRNRRSRRRPIRRAGSRALSLHRRIEAWLTRRKRAASAVFSSLSLNVTLVSRFDSIAGFCILCTTPWGRHSTQRSDNAVLGLELRQLRAFLEVANAQHFGHAAQALKITQPALTQRIQALERELGVRLLQRSARGVRLTAAGEILLPYATSLIQVEDRALRELADNAAGRSGRLRLSYQVAADTPLMGSIMSEFRRRFPNVEVETGSAYSVMNVEQLVAGTMDAAFVALPVPHPDSVATRPISEDEVLVAVSARHRFADMDVVPVEMLSDQPMILFPKALSPLLTAAFRRWLVGHTGVEPNVVAEEPFELALLIVAQSDSVIAFGNSQWTSAVPIPGVVYRRMKPSAATSFGIAWRRDDESPQVANLLAIAEEVAKRHGPAPSDGRELIAHG